MQAHWRALTQRPVRMPDTHPLDFPHTQVTEVRDYPEWHRGRSRYGLWMIPVNCPALLAHIEQLKRQLSDLLHPSDRQPHITLFVCGFEQPEARLDDDFTPTQLQQQIAALRALHSRPCTLYIGPPTSFSSAAYLPVADPQQRLEQWRQALGKVCGEVRQAAYVPHITLGLYRRQVSSQVLHQRLRSLVAPAAMSLSVEALEYVSYLQSAQFSRLECHQRIPLPA